MGRELTTRQKQRELSRDSLLDAGEALAREMFAEGKADPLRLLSASQIADRASRSRGMLYHLWPVNAGESDKLAAYRHTLFLKIFERSFDTGGLLEAVQPHLGGSMEELVRAAAEFDFARYRAGGSEASDYRFTTLMTIAGEAVAAAISADQQAPLTSEQQAPYQALVEMYSALLEAYGREMVPPLQVEELVETLWSMLDGFTLNSWHFRRLAKEREWPEAPGEWTLFSISALAVVRALTREKQPRASESA